MQTSELERRKENDQGAVIPMRPQLKRYINGGKIYAEARKIVAVLFRGPKIQFCCTS
jgi:hypothetical protein